MRETKWKREELDGQYIRFDLKSPTRELAGVGKLAVRQNPDGLIAVDIFVDECLVPGRGVLTRIWLAEDAIKRATGLTTAQLSKQLTRMSLQMFARHPMLYMESVGRAWVRFWGSVRKP